MELIRVHEQFSAEWAKLTLACYVFGKLSKRGTQYTVEDVYFDFGQDWKYTTIIAHQNGRDWQALCPRDYEKILLTNNIPATCREIVTDKYWYDP